MVTNYDIVLRDYPELVSKSLSCTDHVTYDIKANKVTKCSSIVCRDCKFSDENNSGIHDDCNVRLENWLNAEVTDISDNAFNKNGEITW